MYSAPMAPLVELHQLPGSKRAGVLAVLVERLYHQGKRVVIWMVDEGRRGILDEYLWTFRQLAFVPHVVWEEGMGEVQEPVVLVGRPANPNGATVLVVGDELPPGEWAAGFAEVHDLIPPGGDGQEREAWWAEWRRVAGS